MKTYKVKMITPKDIKEANKVSRFEYEVWSTLNGQRQSTSHTTLGKAKANALQISKIGHTEIVIDYWPFNSEDELIEGKTKQWSLTGSKFKQI